VILEVRVFESRVVHLGKILVCTLFLCALALAAEQKSPTKLSDLPAEAQQAISAALARDLPGVQDSTLTASDGANDDNFGISVAIDGNTVVVGAQFVTINGNAEQGAVYVFVKPPRGWANMTQTAELTASDGQSYDSLGCSVGISGSTVVSGACNATVNGNQAQGASYIFVEPAGGWTNMTQTAKLTASDGVAAAYFGTAVAIDGNTIAMGAPQYTDNPPGVGASYVFVEPNGGWTNMTQTAELTPSDGGDYDYFGYAVSISSNTVIIGGGRCGSGCPGTAYVYVEPLNGWADMTETAQLTQSDPSGDDVFGGSVSISGNAAAVGAQNHGREGAGAVYVFVEPAGGWIDMTQTAELSVSGTKEACLGSSVAVAGKVILAGASCTHIRTGAAYVFVKPAGGWQNSSRFAVRLSIPFRYQNDLFGNSVAVSGTTGVVGAVNAPTSKPCYGGLCIAGPGEAFVFTEQ
jgi:hypothetical protein